MNLIIILVVAGLSLATAAEESGDADLTNYISYPECCDDPDADDKEECEEDSACKYVGQFAFVDGEQPLSWVKEHNIIAIHNKFSSEYKLKTFRITQGSHSIEATVYDECSDDDCDGCCTENMKNSGFLIDMEKYTLERFGGEDGVVQWECLDC